MQLMATYVVSDLHGAADALRKAVPEGSTLLLLGDLVNFLDYTSMTGILTEVYERSDVEEVVRLRTAGRVDEARALIHERSLGRENEVHHAISSRVLEQYRAVLGALAWPTYLILGNVDQPALVDSLVDDCPGVVHADGRVVDVDGERFGFIGGALPTPMHVAGEITEEAMRAKIEGLGEVDVLCSHIPPDVEALCFDTRANKYERGSVDLLTYIEDFQPRWAYFGHVHQPLLSSVRIGRTICINVGYFRATQRAWRHAAGDW